jgi:O-antigen/teichoic acid export membrane protein
VCPLSTVQRVAKNTGIIIIGSLIFRIISLFVVIYLARYLGVVDFGKYSFIFAYLAFFGIITDLGLQEILVREMSRDDSIAPKLIGNAYIIRLILTVFAFVMSIIIITLMSYPTDTTTYIYIASCTLLFISFSDFYITIFQANLKMVYNIIAKLVYRVVSAGLIFWIIFSHGTIMQILIALVFSEMVKTLISYLFSRKFVKARFEIDFGLWKYLFKEALPLALGSVIWTIYFRIDVLMLSMMQGDAPVGIYSAAYKLSEPLSLIPAALVVSLFPIMSASFIKSEERLIKSYRLAIRYLMIIILPIAIGTTLIADEIILLIYGAEFADSVTVLQILIWTLVFISVNQVLTTLLVAMGKQKLYTASMGICASANITLNFFLIPVLSFNGAAIATVSTNIIFFLSCYYFISKHLKVPPVGKTLIKPIISSLLMGFFVYYLYNMNVTIFLLVPLAVAIYLVALLALKTFSEEDWDIIKKVVGRR